MFAVIRTGGKQYRVTADDTLQVGKLAGEPGVARSDLRDERSPLGVVELDGPREQVGKRVLPGARIHRSILRPPCRSADEPRRARPPRRGT